jgi:hypothetical protein
MDLIFNVFPYHVSSSFITYTPDKISITPEFPCPLLRQASLPRLAASHFPPASKLTGI